MTYKKKSYKKFVATAATATLVASAIVPAVSAASFPDVEEKHEFATYIDAAVEAGYIKGYADGTFGINDNLKRSQVVIIIGRYLEKLGYTSEATTSPWSDVKDEEVIKYGNIVKDAGVFTGYADGTLKGGGFITRENMAVVLDRLAKTVTGTSFADVAKDIEDVKIGDLATANADYQASIQALRDLGISTADNFNPKGNLKRGQFAKFIMNAVEKIDEITPEAPEAPELVVESVDAIKAITVVEGTDVLAKLPTTVEATVVDSKEKVTLDIKWTAPEGFEGKAGKYEFTGTVTSANEKVVISEDKATVKVAVEIITEAAYKEAVAAVKKAAEKGTEEEFQTALENPALGLTFDEKHIGDIQDDENKLAVSGYKTAIAEAFSAATVEEIQAIIDTVDTAFETYNKKVEAGLVADIVEANTVTAFKTALYASKAKLAHLVTKENVTTAELNAYRKAITAANPTTLEEVQAVIEKVNHATVEKEVAAAETATAAYTAAAKSAPLAKDTTGLKAKAVDADTAADTVLAKYEALYTGEEVFDVKATEEDKAGKYATRLAAVTKAIADADAAVEAAKVDFDIKALTPTITAKQVAEVTTGDAKKQSQVDVTVKYPKIDDEKVTLYGNQNKYYVDSVITVPAEFAGAPLVLTVDGAELNKVVPAVAKEGDTTISFSLADLTGADLTTLGSNEGNEWTVSVKVPYETTTLKAGDYNVKFASVVSTNFNAAEEELEVLTIASTSLSVKVIQDPTIPNAIAAVYTAAQAEGEAATVAANTLEKLKDPNLATAGLKDVKDANAAAYAAAFKAANPTGATIVTVQEIVNTVNAAEALKAAIAALVAAPSLDTLKVEEFGWSADTTKNELPLVDKNKELYVTAIKEAVAAATESAPAFKTAADVKALVEAVNATPIGTLNAQTSLTAIEKALLALNDADVTMLYNEIVNQGNKTSVLNAIKNRTTGFETVEDVINFLLNN